MEAIPARINWHPNFNYKKCLHKTAMNTEETLRTNKSKLCMPEINNHAQLRHQKKPTIFSQKEWVLDKYSHTHTVFQGHSLPCPKGNRGQREKLPDHAQTSRQSKEEKEIIKHEEFSTWTYQVLYCFLTLRKKCSIFSVLHRSDLTTPGKIQTEGLANL